MVGPLEETQTWSIKKDKVDVLFMLRGDQESMHIEKRNEDKLRQIINSNDETSGLSFELVDWWDQHRFFDEHAKELGPRLKFKVTLLIFICIFKSSVSI